MNEEGYMEMFDENKNEEKIHIKEMNEEGYMEMFDENKIREMNEEECKKLLLDESKDENEKNYLLIYLERLEEERREKERKRREEEIKNIIRKIEENRKNKIKYMKMKSKI